MGDKIINGSKTNHSLTSEASSLIGLSSGTPVVLSYIDAVCAFLGSGGYETNKNVGSSSLGTTSVHMKAAQISKIKLNTHLKSGYVMLLPIENTALQLQTNMSGMMNVNWIISLVNDIFKDFNIQFSYKNFLIKIDKWIEITEPQKLIYHPYEFKMSDMIITNFHQPQSTLMMLVSVFANKDFIMHAYQEAIKKKYRFYSYGDAMIIM